MLIGELLLYWNINNENVKLVLPLQRMRQILETRLLLNWRNNFSMETIKDSEMWLSLKTEVRLNVILTRWSWKIIFSLAAVKLVIFFFFGPVRGNNIRSSTRFNKYPPWIYATFWHSFITCLVCTKQWCQYSVYYLFMRWGLQRCTD